MKARLAVLIVCHVLLLLLLLQEVERKLAPCNWTISFNWIISSDFRLFWTVCHCSFHALPFELKINGWELVACHFKEMLFMEQEKEKKMSKLVPQPCGLYRGHQTKFKFSNNVLWMWEYHVIKRMLDQALSSSPTHSEFQNTVAISVYYTYTHSSKWLCRHVCRQMCRSTELKATKTMAKKVMHT